MQPTHHAVIARYEEDITWVRELKVPVTIYNKGKTPTGLESDHAVISRPNMGRESETYLHHIIENYDSLPDYLFLIQGKPFDHCSQIIEIVNSFTPQHRIVPLGHNWKRETLKGNYNWEGFKECLTDMAQLIGIPTDSTIRYSAGAQYVVPKARILAQPKEYYEAVIKRVNHSVNPLEGWAMERLWPYLFSERNKTDLITCTIVSTGANQLSDEKLKGFLQMRPDIVFLSSDKENALENSQDFIFITDTPGLFSGEMLGEMIDSFLLLKLALPGEQDVIMGTRDDLSLYARENIRPILVLQGSRRHWREAFTLPSSYLVHSSTISQHGNYLKERRIPLFTPIPSMIQ